MKYLVHVLNLFDFTFNFPHVFITHYKVKKNLLDFASS